MVTTYALQDVTTIHEAGVYSDAALTTLVEDLTSAMQNIATGEYKASTPITFSLYSLGTPYYLKLDWTPAGGTRRTDSIKFQVFPQGQAGGAAVLTGTDCEGAYLQNPTLAFRLGRGGFREADFENWTVASQDRFVVDFPLPSATGDEQDMHLLFSCGRAGAPMAIEAVTLWADVEDPFGGQGETGKRFTIEAPIGPAGEGGYRGTVVSRNHYRRRSRNLSVHTDIHRSRPGYKIQRQIAQAAAEYLERIPIDEVDGTLHAAILLGDTFYEDGTTPTSRGTVTNSPYDAAANPVGQWAYIRGHVPWVDGTDFRLLKWTGGQLKVKSALPDPGNPALAAVAGTDGIDDDTYYVRIQTKDSDTDTASGPNARTGTATTQAVAAGEVLQVSAPAFNSRVTHWRIQITKTSNTDTPSAFEICETVYSAATGGTNQADANGWIPIGTSVAYVRDNPASGIRFPFRTVGAVSVYQHSNPPTGAAHVVHYKGRALYAPSNDTWLVLSEADNPEHFYNDPSSPHEGFNTFRGEQQVDTVPSPCTALAATENQVLFFFRTGLVVVEGSLAIDIDTNTAQVRGRDVQVTPVAENTLGFISPSVQIVGQDAYGFSEDGPAIYSGGGVLGLDTEAVRADWLCRDPLYEHRGVVGYSPRHKLVLFAYASKDAPVAGVPDTVLAWSIEKRQWCPPWTLGVTSFTLHRVVDIDSAASIGTQLVFGGPYGSMNQFGYGHGDGEDGSDVDAVDLLSTGATSTSATVSGKAWTTNEWRGKGFCLTDRTTGRRYYRVVKSNTGDTISWDGAVTDSGGGWLLNFGGYPQEAHLGISSPGGNLTVQKVQAMIQDALSVV